MRNKFLFIGFFLITFFLQAQETAESEAKVRDIVYFYQYLLNTLGAENTPARDKEIIIRESFRKIFLDEKVQIEDDLDEYRSVLTYKDVRAYLQDVDFFFKKTAFEFEILGITQAQSESGANYFKVEMNRKLSVVTLDGSSIVNTKKRYIEINQDAKTGDLIIVSVYTSPFNRTTQLKEWWLSLPLAWREVFFAKFGVYEDSITNQQLNLIAQLDSLDLNGNNFIENLDPTYVLTSLKFLDISDTRIESLQPLRSTSKLTGIAARNAPISDLQFLKFNEGLLSLDLTNTKVSDLQFLAKHPHLKQLNLSGLTSENYTPLSALNELENLSLSGSNFSEVTQLSMLKSLKKLDLSNTGATSLSGIEGLQNISELSINFTAVSSLQPVSNLQELKLIYLNQTQIASILPLSGCRKLEKVYADNIPAPESDYEQFSTNRPKVLLIRNAKQIENWWGLLSPEYKTVFTNYLGTQNPSTESIIRFLSVDSLDLSGAPIRSFQPIKAFKRLNWLNIDNTNLSDFSGISELTQLTYLSAILTKASFVDVNLPKKLKTVRISGTTIESMKPFLLLNYLEFLDLDDTEVPNKEIESFIATHPECEVIYRTDELLSWWDGLSPAWKEVLIKEVGDSQDKRALHRFTSQSSLHVKDALITDLSPLFVFSQLRELTLVHLPLGSVANLPFIEQLISLSVVEMPLADLSPLKQASKLTKLDLRGTAVGDLRPLQSLSTLEELDVSGTPLKRLNGLEELYKLRKLNCSNTGVFTLGRITQLTSLNHLICFNTKLKPNDLESLRKAVPDCQIVFY